MLAYYHSPDLPWTLDEESEERYRRIRKRIAIAFLILAILIPLLPLPKVDRQEAEQVPPRLAKLLTEQRQQPPAPVPAPRPEAEAPKPEPKKAEPKKEPPKPEVRTVEKAREKAMRSGLLAMRDDLAALRSDPNVESVRSTQLTKGAKTAAKVPERSMITAGAGRGSGGINTAALSRDTGGKGLAGRATTQVDSPVGVGGGGGSVQRGGSGRPGRSIEEVQLIFDKNKSAIYALYNRALRQDPTLKGKVVLKITIDPSGRVTACQIVSSELRSPDLERKLTARVMQFDFGPKNVDVMVVTYPIDFLPS